MRQLQRKRGRRGPAILVNLYDAVYCKYPGGETVYLSCLKECSLELIELMRIYRKRYFTHVFKSEEFLEKHVVVV